MKAKVLIVDDDQDIVTMLQDRLDAGGYKTLTAGDGQRGLELIEQESPNLVLLDLYLPRLKGMDVLK
ncbi:MAG TPA: response regulator, partial [Nitrospira sp.]|nr:response regulator [Nitrospira sp.]